LTSAHVNPKKIKVRATYTTSIALASVDSVNRPNTAILGPARIKKALKAPFQTLSAREAVAALTSF
jgi:hypothetical protein